MKYSKVTHAFWRIDNAFFPERRTSRFATIHRGESETKNWSNKEVLIALLWATGLSRTWSVHRNDRDLIASRRPLYDY